MTTIQARLDPFPHVLLEDVYTEYQLPKIWEELNFLCYPEKLLPPNLTGSASDDDGVLLKQNSCVWLDDIYAHPTLSNILGETTTFQKLTLRSICKMHPHWYFKNAKINYTSNLISYYENGGYYGPHNDQAYFTCLTWFYKEPKAFTGGNLYFPDYDYTVSCDHNKSIIFPSPIIHQVIPIEMPEEFANKKLGRFCYSQFFSLIPVQESVSKDYFNIRYIV